MSIDLVRVDDRLIHGQVVVGWVQALGIDRIVLVDDAVAASEWERELYSLGVPPGLEVAFASVDQAVRQMAQWAGDRASTLILVQDVNTVMRLAERSDLIHRINLGGVHEAQGRSERLSYVFLSDAEVQQLRALSERGVTVSAQDVPTARPVALKELL